MRPTANDRKSTGGSRKRPERIRVLTTRTPKTVNVGIDFGTSTSKVAVRDVDVRRSYLIPLRGKKKGYEKYLFPSTVLIKGGRLFFGKESAVADSNFLRSFKVCVACGANAFERVSCDSGFRGCSGDRGLFNLDGGDVVRAEHVAAWYLGYLMKVAETTVHRRFGDAAIPLLTFNSAVPIDHLEKGQVRKTFERVVSVAYAIRDHVSQGMELSRARILWENAERDLQCGSDKANQRAFILAEPLAAVISYNNSPLADEGFHCIVDIGAGTTDVAFFRRWTVRGDPKVAFYHCDNHLVGGDDVDYALARCLKESQPERRIRDLLRIARSAKERHSEEGLRFQVRGPGTLLNTQQLTRLVGPIGRRIFDGCQTTWRGAYKKHTCESVWRNYGIFVIGGSARFEPLRGMAVNKPWDRIERLRPLAPLLPKDFETLDPAEGELLKSNAELFAVTYGVSRHCAEWPEFYRPMDVSIYEIPKPKKLVPTWEQYLNQD